MKNILVIRFSAMGDVLLTTPLLRILKAHLPDTSVDFLVKAPYEPLLRWNPYITNVFKFSAQDKEYGFRGILRILNRQQYDAVIDLQASQRSVLLCRFLRCQTKIRYRPSIWRRFLLVHLRIDTYGDSDPIPIRYLKSVTSLGVKDDGQGLDLIPGKHSEDRISDKLTNFNISSSNRLIAMAPGDSRQTKCWLPEGFARVGTYFQEKGYRIVLIGGSDDRKICSDVSGLMKQHPVDLSGHISILDTGAVLKRSALLVTNDTGAMHMATALKTPVVALFGPTSRQLGFMPFQAPSIVIEKDLKCRPCSYHGTERCKKSHFECMRLIAPEEVIESAETLMGRGGGE